MLILHKNIPYPIEFRNDVIKCYADGFSSRKVGEFFGLDHSLILQWVKLANVRRNKNESSILQSVNLKGIRRSKNTEFKAGHSTWNKGLEWKEMQGKYHPNWRGGKRKYPYSWKESFKEIIRERDGRKCKLCGTSEKEFVKKLEVHHIDYNKENINLKNLISLCKSCHTKTGFNREHWIKVFCLGENKCKEN